MSCPQRFCNHLSIGPFDDACDGSRAPFGICPRIPWPGDMELFYMQICGLITLWWTNMAIEISIFNRRYIFKRFILYCHVSLLEGTHHHCGVQFIPALAATMRAFSNSSRSRRTCNKETPGCTHQTPSSQNNALETCENVGCLLLETMVACVNIGHHRQLRVLQNMGKVWWWKPSKEQLQNHSKPFFLHILP